MANQRRSRLKRNSNNQLVACAGQNLRDAILRNHHVRQVICHSAANINYRILISSLFVPFIDSVLARNCIVYHNLHRQIARHRRTKFSATRYICTTLFNNHRNLRKSVNRITQETVKLTAVSVSINIIIPMAAHSLVKSAEIAVPNNTRSRQIYHFHISALANISYRRRDGYSRVLTNEQHSIFVLAICRVSLTCQCVCELLDTIFFCILNLRNIIHCTSLGSDKLSRRDCIKHTRVAHCMPQIQQIYRLGSLDCKSA